MSISRRIRSFVVGLAILTLVSTPTVAAASFSIATGPSGGVFFLVGSALAQVLNRYLRGDSAIVVPATGSAHGLELIHRGEATLAFTTLAAAHFGVRGEREFDRKYDNVALVMAAMDAGQSLVTLPDSGIKTFADVKGLRIAANSDSSKVQLLAALAAHGVRERDVRVRLMSYAEQLSALRERTLDAGFVALSPYNRDLAGFASGQPIRIVGLDAARAKVLDQQPYSAPIGVARGTYPGQDADLLVPGSHTTLLASKAADPGLIYRITKIIAEHASELAELHPGGREFTAAKTRYLIDHHLLPVGFHPGAERYWREKGVLR